MQAVIVGIAAVVGVLIGYFLRASDAKAAKDTLQASNALLDRSNREIRAELDKTKSELSRVQAESNRRAAFEAVAAERGNTIFEMTAEREKMRGDLQSKTDAERDHAAHVSQLEADLRNERDSAADKIALLESARQTLANQFEVLAGEILERKSKSFSEGSQTELGNILSPLREQLREFREKVEKVQVDSNSGVTKLETLIGTLGGLNQQLAEEARNLSTALRGSAKAQGDWGEFILRDLLEKAGLREGEQYTFQETFESVSENGDRKRARTDVIVYLPGGRHLIIDSKVSLTAYTDYVNAVTDEERNAALKLHLASVRSHLNGLGKASYHRLSNIESPDFVVMFVPIEPAFLLALQRDAALWSDGYAQNLLLVGPTTLLYVIRIVHILWEQEKQTRNVTDVMERGAKLYDKFVGFIADMEEIGKGLRDATKSYEGARRKLTSGDGNLIRQVEMLRSLGVKPRKSLPPKLFDGAEIESPDLVLAAGAEEAEVDD